jgi:hypothetical protein
MNIQTFADLIAAAATLPPGGGSQVARAACSGQDDTHFTAANTTCSRLPRDTIHRHCSIAGLLFGLSKLEVATHPVYNLQ